MKRQYIYLLLTVICLPIYGLSAPDLNQSGIDHVRQPGFVTEATTGDDVWAKDGAYPFLSTATMHYASSSSGSDTSSGTGCRTIQVEGLDGDYAYSAQTVTLTSDVRVAISTLLRVNKVTCLTAGSGGVNAGNIQVGTESIAMAYVPANYGESQQLIYTVPASKYAVLSFWDVSVASAGYVGGQIGLQMRESGAAWRTIDLVTGTGASGAIQKNGGNAIKLPPKSDLRVRVIAADGKPGVMGSLEIHQKR